MNNYQYIDAQYKLVKIGRNILLTYCQTIEKKDLVKPHTNFGGSSIQYLLVHIADCYRAWLSRALSKSFEKTDVDNVHSVQEARLLFTDVDRMMQDFIAFIRKENPKILNLNHYGKIKKEPPLSVFSHVITHEFHHKGQILSMSRQLGYMPVDTDII